MCFTIIASLDKKKEILHDNLKGEKKNQEIKKQILSILVCKHPFLCRVLFNKVQLSQILFSRVHWKEIPRIMKLESI